MAIARPNRAVGLLCAAVLPLALMSAPAGAQTAEAEPYRTRDFARIRNILPPGSDGSVTAAQAAQAGADDPQTRIAVEGKDAPPNFADQLEMYDALGRQGPGTLTEESLDDFFKDASFGARPADVVRTYRPRPGVVVQRDRFGVPHVYGQTYEDVAFGAGFVGTEDRMFLQDVLRHVGAARLSEFLGPSESNKASDRAQLRVAGYDDAEAAAQVDQLSERFGAEGAKFERGLDAFVEGINTAQRQMCPANGPVGPQCPPEYAALGPILPDDWDRADITYIASLVGGIFGRGGGQEFTNAKWLQKLEARFGAADGRQVFEDLRERDDPEAPTTVDTPFPYLTPPTAVDQDAVAMPDADAPVTPGTGGTTGLSAGFPEAVDGPLGKIPLLQPGGMSNALVVAADETSTGRPLAVFGPQTGYFAPQLLTEVDLHGPGYDARGVSFAGTQLIVQLGRGQDYAWSATSAGGDLVDQVVEELCPGTRDDPQGDPLKWTAYRYQGKCVDMLVRTHRQLTKPGPAGIGSPQVFDLPVQRTVHGPVLLRTRAEGKPVALVEQRSTFAGELDSAIGFMRINDPAFVHDAESFKRAFDKVDYTFNWFYVDDRDIAYFNSGKLPVRHPSVDPDLPRWGTGEYDWQGWLPFEAHPQGTNPPSGFFANWNNKPAPGFGANDAQWSYGPVYRSGSLEDRISDHIAGSRTVSEVELVEAMTDAGQVDARADILLPLLLDVVGNESDPAVRLLRDWHADGALREDRDRQDGYSHQAAIAIFDAWWESPGDGSDGEIAVAKDVLRAVLAEDTDALPEKLDDHPRIRRGSAWNGVAWYGYVHKDLRQLLGRPVTAPYSRTYCGAGSLDACRSRLRASLAEAVRRQLAEQDTADVAALRYDKSIDAIVSSAVGLVGVRRIDWQNRPTFQQVVDVPGHRPRAGGAGSGGAGSGGSSGEGGGRRAGGGDPVARADGRSLPATGGGPVLPGLAVALSLAAAYSVRRRSPG